MVLLFYRPRRHTWRFVGLVPVNLLFGYQSYIVCAAWKRGIIRVSVWVIQGSEGQEQLGEGRARI